MTPAEQAINAHAARAHAEIRAMTLEALVHLTGRVSFDIRSIAQQRRWRLYRERNDTINN